MESHVDFKFEQFLKRKFLDQEEFEQIYYYGIGILVKKGTNKDYGHVVVSNKAIYWVNDPPKVVNKEIDLKDLVSVELRDNYPDFLEGEFKKKCQHFEVKFLKPGKPEQDLSASTKPENTVAKKVSFKTEQSPPAAAEVKVAKVGCCGRGRRHQPTGEPPEEPPPLVIENGDNRSEMDSLNEDRTDVSEQSVDLDYKMDETLVLTARSNYIVENNLVETSIDIYILNGDLKLLPCIYNASDIALEKKTLSLNDDYEMLHRPLVTMEEDTLNYHYRQLKEDLQASRFNPMQVFKYTNELCNAARRYFHIKKLFWAGDDMWDYYIKQLERIYPKSRLDLTVRKHIIQRVDELELALLIFELLSCMMDGTHMLGKRAAVLRGQRSERVYKLLYIIITHPDLPQFDQHPRTAILKHASNETKLLMNEILLVCGDILHSLILDGAFTPPQDVDDFTEASIVGHFEKNIENCKAFFMQYISLVINLLKPPEDRNIHREPELILQPHEVVQINHAFTVIQSLIRYSLKLREFFVDEFSVDFKFCMQKHQIMQRLSPNYPITYNTLKLVAKVTPLIANEAPSLL